MGGGGGENCGGGNLSAGKERWVLLSATHNIFDNSIRKQCDEKAEAYLDTSELDALDREDA